MTFFVSSTMKSSLELLPFLVTAFSTYFLISCDASPDIVRDMNGDILRSGRYYFIIMPGVHGKDSALTMRSTRNETCPLDAAQSKHGTNKRYAGLFSFTPFNLKKGVIRESTDLNIDSPGGSVCGVSTVWKLDSYSGENVVSTQGVIGNPGAETLGNWFKIEKYLKHYKLVYCPSVCNTCKAMCKDIGISKKDNSGRLVLNNQPFMVKFKPY